MTCACPSLLPSPNLALGLAEGWGGPMLGARGGVGMTVQVRLIGISGPDGSGKSTLAAAVRSEALRRGVPARVPGAGAQRRDDPGAGRRRAPAGHQGRQARRPSSWRYGRRASRAGPDLVDEMLAVMQHSRAD
jgi:hypothetical protein